MANLLIIIYYNTHTSVLSSHLSSGFRLAQGPCVLIFHYASTGATFFFLERCPFPGMFAQGPLWNALPSGNPGDSLPPSPQVFK